MFAELLLRGGEEEEEAGKVDGGEHDNVIITKSHKVLLRIMTGWICCYILRSFIMATLYVYVVVTTKDTSMCAGEYAMGEICVGNAAERP